MALNSCMAWLHFILSFFICGINDNLESKIMPRNLCSSVMGISVLFNVSLGWLCILWIWQKCTHFVLLFEIVNPFSVVHFWILFMHCCIFLSMVVLFLELQQMRKSSTYNDPLISGGRLDVMLFIFIINRDTDKMLPWGTPPPVASDQSMCCQSVSWKIGLQENFGWRWEVYLVTQSF